MKALLNVSAPKIITPLDLGGYHDDLAGNILYVWVNLSRDMHDRYDDIQVDFVKLGKATEQASNRLQIANKAKRIVDLTKERIDQIMIAHGEEALVKAQADAADYDDALAAVEANNVALTEANDIYHAWLAEILSQRQDKETHYTLEELREVASNSYDNDNSSFWRWMTQTIQAMVIGHVNNHLKG